MDRMNCRFGDKMRSASLPLSSRCFTVNNRGSGSIAGCNRLGRRLFVACGMLLAAVLPMTALSDTARASSISLGSQEFQSFLGQNAGAWQKSWQYVNISILPAQQPSAAVLRSSDTSFGLVFHTGHPKSDWNSFVNNLLDHLPGLVPDAARLAGEIPISSMVDGRYVAAWKKDVLSGSVVAPPGDRWLTDYIQVSVQALHPRFDAPEQPEAPSSSEPESPPGPVTPPSPDAPADVEPPVNGPEVPSDPPISPDLPVSPPSGGSGGPDTDGNVSAPEPGALTLLGTGLVCLLGYRRWRHRAAQRA
jgi:hypothetical protein